MSVAEWEVIIDKYSCVTATGYSSPDLNMFLYDIMKLGTLQVMHRCTKNVTNM